MSGINNSAKVLELNLVENAKILGAPGVEVNVPIKMEALPQGQYSSITAAFVVPEGLEVKDVVFNEANIVGNCEYESTNGQLKINVKGDAVQFYHDSTDLFVNVILKVAKFATAEETVVFKPEYIKVDAGKLVYNVDDVAVNIVLEKLDTGALTKIPGYGNPLRDYKLGADPFAVVYEGRVYIYMSSDEYMYGDDSNLFDNNFRQLNRVFVISSDDMVNWKDHGAIPVAGFNNINDGRGIAKWAGGSWAPAAAYKKIDGEDKFFLYFSNTAGGIGVLVADTPIGPWEDPLGEALITHETPGVAGVVWLFDPAVLVDDDGTAYLYFGGGLPGGRAPSPEQVASPKTARVIRLGDDMISTVGEAKLIDAPYMFENSGIHKYDGRYYYSYCTNFGPRPEDEDSLVPGEIAYMVSDQPMGPFSYKGNILKNPQYFFSVGGNNHHAIFEFEDQWYIVYHAQTVAKDTFGDGKGYRSPHINKVEFDQNGLMKDIQGDRTGIAQLRPLNPYQRIEAETIAWCKGISTEDRTTAMKNSETVNLMVTDINDGDWIAVANADFGEEGPSTFEANIASAIGGQIEIRIDSPIGEVIGTLDVQPNGEAQEWNLLQCDVKSVTGIHNIFFMFKGDKQSNLFAFDYWQFK